MKQNERGKFEMGLRFWRKKEKTAREVLKDLDLAMLDEAMRLEVERSKEKRIYEV